MCVRERETADTKQSEGANKKFIDKKGRNQEGISKELVPNKRHYDERGCRNNER
jgi:hypothetical protein